MANYLITQLNKQVSHSADMEFCKFRAPDSEQWQSTSWREFGLVVRRAACALAAIGAQEKGMAAFCSPNRPEALAAEFACFHHRICGVPIYAYSSQEQFNFIMLNSGARIIFAGAPEQLELARGYADKHPDMVDHIILLYNPADAIDCKSAPLLGWDDFLTRGTEDFWPQVEARTERGEPADMASLIYTSGTTGDPKGVMLLHSNFDAAVSEHLKRLPEILSDELSLSFLPMSHVFEKAWTFFCIARGLRIAFNYDPRQVEKALKEVNPNLMCCVPRFWEKIYTGIISQIESMGFLQRMMVHRAMKVGATRNLYYKRLGKKVPWSVRKEYAFWDKRFFSKVRHAIGIHSPNFFPTAGAALSDKICGTMRKMGIDLIYGYGMTETTATVTCYPHDDYEIGTVGTPMPNVQVKIADDGEILVKGPTITPGYFKNEQANAEAFTEDGFLRTGDAGYINAHGALVLTHRKKDLYKTSNGKYISPQAIETLLVSDPYIDQVAVIGDMRKYVTALIVPDFGPLSAWAEKHGITDLSREGLCRNKRVEEMLMASIKHLQKHMATFEHIKKITLLAEPFSQDTGELTNTLKLRRKVIAERHARTINAMYPEEFLTTPPVFNNRYK